MVALPVRDRLLQLPLLLVLAAAIGVFGRRISRHSGRSCRVAQRQRLVIAQANSVFEGSTSTASLLGPRSPAPHRVAQRGQRDLRRARPSSSRSCSSLFVPRPPLAATPQERPARRDRFVWRDSLMGLWSA
jgi:hypothetical protein